MEEKSLNTNKCPNCTREFSCTHALGCWCGEIVLSANSLSFLKANFQDCLCPDCIKAMLEGENKHKLN
jgi:hypothetical protein